MPSWDEIYKDKDNIPTYPQSEIFKFIKRLESTFKTGPLKIWDLCCGAGRNSIAMAKMGHMIYSSDISPTGVHNLNSQISDKKYHCETAICDMSVNPWQVDDFNGIVCWDALHHNTIANIKATVDTVHKSLTNGGLFMASLLSVNSDHHKRGRQIEVNTYINDQGLESGVPHHYFDEIEIKKLFKAWKICILAEIIVNYIETEFEFYKNNPFPYTKWNVLVTKES